MLIETKTNYLV